MATHFSSSFLQVSVWEDEGGMKLKKQQHVFNSRKMKKLRLTSCTYAILLHKLDSKQQMLLLLTLKAMQHIHAYISLYWCSTLVTGEVYTYMRVNRCGWCFYALALG